ncbi:MAG: hypothetical protein RIQ56_429 [Candidatus Parcubacteria bacterium]|jgi:uncharacterized protein (DUF305 family)
MENTKKGTSVALTFTMFFVGGIIGFWVGSSGYATQSGVHVMPDGTVMPNMVAASIDKQFIVDMIPHHEGAIAMAKIALRRSQRGEIKKLAAEIVSAQEKEIRDMTSWYSEWFGGTVPESSMAGMHMQGMMGVPSALESVSDKDFDKVFIDQMIPHHEMAVMMAMLLGSGTDREEMKGLAEAVHSSQSAEIEKMKSWRRAWYE